MQVLRHLLEPRGLAANLTLLGSALLVGVGLVELALYGAVTTGDPTTVRVGSQLLPALQRAYPIAAAPMVFLPLSALLWTRFHLLSLIGIGLGGLFLLLGLLEIWRPELQILVDLLSSLQGI